MKHFPQCLTVTRYCAEADEGASSVDFVSVDTEQGHAFDMAYDLAQVIFGIELEPGTSRDLTCAAWYPYIHMDEPVA